MAAPKDYYKTLGVSETASADEIKKAYRKLAKKNHPDVTGGDKTKEARFKEIGEAYETLGDEKKRAAYDELRRNPFAGAQGGFPGGGFPGGFGGGGFQGGTIDLNEILNRMRGEVRQERAARQKREQQQQQARGTPFDGFDLFEMFGGGGPEARRQAHAPATGQDVVTRLDLELPEAALGVEKELVVDGKRLTVHIPPGVTDGKTIRLAGQGQSLGGAPGDLLIEIHEKPHARFRRAKPGSADIEVDLPVPLDVAVLGGKADVPTLEGTHITLTVPAASSSGRKLRLRGKGAHADKTTRGDLYAVVSIHVPSEISPEARELITRFAAITKK